MNNKQFFIIACAMQLLLLSNLHTQAQPAQFTFTFHITGKNGEPIKGAKLSAPGSNDGYTDDNGYITYRVPYGYVTITAAGYKRKLHSVLGVQYGSTIDLGLKAMPVETRNIQVTVQDKNGMPISGAEINVMPGTTTYTNAQGQANAQHTQLIGDYVTLVVHANGFKTQQQRIMIGENRVTHSIRTPDDKAEFILVPDKHVVTSLTVEVLDSKTSDPVSGASVTIKVINGGNVGTTSTTGKGEASFNGIDADGQLRVMVKHTGYTEKWSDVPEDLMESDDNHRRFLVYLDPEATGKWSGTWLDPNNATASSTISGDPPSSRTSKYQVSGRPYICTVTYTNFKVEGNTVKYKWAGHYEDDDKTVERKGSGSMTLNGDSLSCTDNEEEDNFSWKSGKSPYSSAMHKGAVWSYTLVRKK